MMNWQARLVIALPAPLVGALVVALARGMRLGVPGQWEWLRLPAQAAIPWSWMGLAFLCCGGFTLLAILGLQALKRPGGRIRELAWLASLALAAPCVQLAVTSAAPDEYDLTKWAYVNFFKSSAGYFIIARDQAKQNPWAFAARYPEWIKSQDALHIGTHPPGLILLEAELQRLLDPRPDWANQIIAWSPPSANEGFRQLESIEQRPLPRADRAALLLTAIGTLLACSWVVIPLYLLVRASTGPATAWMAACAWPLTPAAILFQPLADTAYPLGSTAALALAVWSSRFKSPSSSSASACSCGAVLALGCSFTMAFLPVGLIIALWHGLESRAPLRRKALLLAATGAGFLLPWLLFWLATGANPLSIALWNLHHHARFYDEFPRSYAIWVWVDLLELAIALGIASSTWVGWGLFLARPWPRGLAASLIVLGLVDLSGRNLGEVARLWQLFMPLLLPAAAAGLDRERAGGWGLAILLALNALQTLALEAQIQVVYPVN